MQARFNTKVCEGPGRHTVDFILSSPSPQPSIWCRLHVRGYMRCSCSGPKREQQNKGYLRVLQIKNLEDIEPVLLFSESRDQ